MLRLKLVLLSLSARRAWIEMDNVSGTVAAGLTSLSARRAWIEIFAAMQASFKNVSLSARRAWIEMRVSTIRAVSV